MMGSIVTLTGASGVGKTTITDKLLLSIPDIKFIGTLNTRERRKIDRPEDSYSVSQQEFEKRKQAGEFLWTVKVHEHWKGTLKSAVDDALLRPSSSLIILVPEIVPILLKYAPNHVFSFFIPSPSEEILRARLLKRGDSSQDIEQRINDCKRWDDAAKASGLPYIFITNEGPIEDTVSQILRNLPRGY
ncbi:MAG: hypothetical protein Q7S62_02570 [bacterium]|nr:hypothetical protein [bacterium]